MLIGLRFQLGMSVEQNRHRLNLCTGGIALPITPKALPEKQMPNHSQPKPSSNAPETPSGETSQSPAGVDPGDQQGEGRGSYRSKSTGEGGKL